MKRLHVHVSVDNMADSIRFYSCMFAASPTVLKDDYAKWMLEDPRMNFAISQRGAPAGLNHLGIQVEAESELSEMQDRLHALQPGVSREDGVACCYAKSDKYWVNDPSGIAWETFHTLGTIPVFGNGEVSSEAVRAESACCIPLAQDGTQSAAPCCVPTGQQAAVAGKCC